MLRDDNKLLTDFGVYKECVVQLMLKKAPSPSDIMNPQTIRQIRERQRKRQQTEDDIQFGDALVIRLISASNLKDSGGCNPYAVLQHDGQVSYHCVLTTLHITHYNPYNVSIDHFSIEPLCTLYPLFDIDSYPFSI